MNKSELFKLMCKAVIEAEVHGQQKLGCCCICGRRGRGHAEDCPLGQALNGAWAWAGVAGVAR